ncbi:MAG: DUF3108 domain-containing protein [Pseudomonadota bacterium]
MKKWLLPFAASALAFAGVSGVSTADNGDTPRENFMANIEAGKPMRMEYEIKANAWVLILPITGKAWFQVDIRPENYKIKSNVKTTGLADILVNYDMELAASGYTNLDGLDTYAYVSQNKDGKKNRRVDLKYLGNRFDMTATPRFGNLGEPPATTEQVLDAKDPITALISYALEPRDLETAPCGGPMKIFDGRQLTHLHFEYKGMKEVKSDAWRGQAYECHIRMDKVAGYKEGEANKDTLTGIDGPLKLWLAPLPNGATVPVRIEADTEDIGKVTLQAGSLNFFPLEE